MLKPIYRLQCGLFLILIMGGGLTSCSVVRVKPQSIATTLSNERDSILNSAELSQATRSVIAITGQETPGCTAQIDDCLKQLRALPLLSPEQYLSTASELFLFKAHEPASTADCQLDPDPNQVQPHEVGVVARQMQAPIVIQQVDPKLRAKCMQQQQNYLLDAVRNAYAYLFFSNRKAEQRLFDNRQVQVRDFYNMAVARLLFLNERSSHIPLSLKNSVAIGNNTIHLQIQSNSLKKLPAPEQLASGYDLSFRGLKSINRRDGFGAEFVAILPQPPAENENVDATTLSQYERINNSRFLPVSVILTAKGNNLEEILKSNEFNLDIYDPYESETVAIKNQQYPLAANFSAAYGLWLARTDLARAAYKGLFDAYKGLASPRLYMLEPYNPNKRVIVLIHGLASSPEAWVSLTNDVMGDPVLRQNFQVWQIFYSTSMPMLESSYEIGQLIKTAFKRYDPKLKNSASSQAVVMGHSMGAVIGRLLVSNTDLTPDALKALSKHDKELISQLPVVKQRLQLQPVPEFKRAVFLSAPFKGTDFANRWYTRAIQRFIRLPQSFSASVQELLANTVQNKAVINRLEQSGLLNFQSGVTELRKGSHFNEITQHVTIAKDIPFHLVMGRSSPTDPLNQSSDGVVEYESAHLDGAASEKVINGGHSIQETPEAILELRRILRLHLENLGDIPSQSHALPEQVAASQSGS